LAEADSRRMFNLQPVLLGVGFALLIAISFATVLLVNRAAADAQRLAQTLEVQDKLSNILLGVRRGESSQRGYLFTGQRSYLREYRGAEPETKSIIADLKTLTKANPARQQMLDRATELADEKFAEMAQTIALHESGRIEDARKLVQSGSGRNLMTQLATLLNDAIADESRIAAERTQSSRNTISRP
jgi:CHASE3 domain sensor protein